MCHFVEQLNGNITIEAKLDISLWDSIDEKKKGETIPKHDSHM